MVRKALCRGKPIQTSHKFYNWALKTIRIEYGARGMKHKLQIQALIQTSKGNLWPPIRASRATGTTNLTRRWSKLNKWMINSYKTHSRICQRWAHNFHNSTPINKRPNMINSTPSNITFLSNSHPNIRTRTWVPSNKYRTGVVKTRCHNRMLAIIKNRQRHPLIKWASSNRSQLKTFK